jgi:FkbM family methyltransferase
MSWRMDALRAGARRWWWRDHEWLGRFVALRGNLVRLEGCRFDVSHPLISNALRARLLRGRYERSERELLAAWLDPAAPVVELGGGIGVVATLVNRRLRHPARHVVVEANPALIPVLERQKALNRARFTIVHGAVAYGVSDTAALHVDMEFISGRIGAAQTATVAVPALTLRQVLEPRPWTDVTLVCDIEGLETELVEYEGDILARSCRTLVIEVHPEFRSAEQRAELFARLGALGFAKVASVRKVHAFRR